MAKVSNKKVVKKVNKTEQKTKTKKTLGDKLLKKLGLKKERRGRPKKRRGFTLIELLAVIVILGLLMSIAVPTVTKYVAQSRKKALSMTVNNYMGALVTEVNSMEYRFKKENTIYAVPIECIPMSKGSGNPFGEWHIATEQYWAYVLVQYNKADSSYKYGFTFKDSSGNGMYPTAQNAINNSGKDIIKNINILTPKTGKAVDLTDLENWSKSGFVIDETTELIVLKVKPEGKYGDGKTTCTLKNKPKNYAAPIEDEEEIIEDLWKGDAYALIIDNSVYASDKLPLIFVRSETPIQAGEMYYSDYYGEVEVIAAYTGFETTVYTGYRSNSQLKEDLGWSDRDRVGSLGFVLETPWAKYVPDITSVVVEDNVRFASLVDLFSGYPNVRYMDLSKIDVSQNTSMNSMFFEIGREWSTDNCHVSGGCIDKWVGGTYVTIIGMDKWDTSNITDMGGMFSDARINSISDISVWDTSNVTSMESMFMYVSGLGIDFSKWNVDKVENWQYFIWDEEAKIPEKFKDESNGY